MTLKFEHRPCDFQGAGLPETTTRSTELDRHNYFLSLIPLQVRASIGHFILKEEALHEKDFPKAPDAEA
jgi:hypothetical protein